MMNYHTWNDMVEIINLKNSYAEAIDGGAVSVPRNRRVLTAQNAEWFVQNGSKFNKNDDGYKMVLDYVNQYRQKVAEKIEVPETVGE